MSREKQNAEIYKSMCEELFNNLEKQYQEMFKVKAESEQIEEMAKILHPDSCFDGDITTCRKMEECYICHANKLYNAGYRKQSEGEWVKDEVGETLCSKCGVRPLYRKSGTTFATTFYPTRSNYCPNCGAKMKGGAE